MVIPISFLSNVRKRYSRMKSLVDRGDIGDPKKDVISIRDILSDARKYQNIDRSEAIRLAYKARRRCEYLIKAYDDQEVDDDVSASLKEELVNIDAFLSGFTDMEIELTMYPSEADEIISKAGDELDLSRQFMNIHRIDSISHALKAKELYTLAINMLGKNSPARKSNAQEGISKAGRLLLQFTDDEISLAENRR